MKHVIARLTLVGSGTMLGLIGGALMFDPISFLEISGVTVEHDPGLLSEMAAPSGVLIASGALMLFGAIKFRFATLSLLVGAVVYGSYGIGRVISMFVHGPPPESLMMATIIEFVVAAILCSLVFTNQFGLNAANAGMKMLQSNP